MEKNGQHGVEVTLSRDLGLLEVLMIGIGPNIGSTIFVLVGWGVGIAGPALILALVLNFVITLFTAFSYAELASAFPETGGGYLWVKEGLFPPLGFLGGWMSWVGHCIACAVYAIGFGQGISWLVAQYGFDFFGLTQNQIVVLFAVLIAAGFTYINYRGVKGAGRSEIFVSVILLGIIGIYVFFTLFAMFSVPNLQENYTPFNPTGEWLAVAAAMGFTFMIFEGYEIVAQTGEEAKNPTKTIPKAMFLCISISTILFLTMTVITIGVSGWENVAAWKSEALVNTAEKTVPFLGSALISIGVVIGSIAAVNSIVFSTSRVSFAMGRDGNLPAVFGKLHPKKHTPTAALFFSGIIIVAMCILLPINQVASTADILILLLFMFVNVAAISLRRKRPDVKRTFTIPIFPILTVVAIFANLFIAATLFDIEPFAWYLAFGIINVGLLIHYFMGGKKAIEEVPIPVRVPLTKTELSIFRVMIPIEDPHSEDLVDLGSLMAAERDGEIMLVSVVEIPSTVPLTDVDRKLVDDRKKMLEKLKRRAEMNGIFTRALVTVSHDVVTALIDTAKEEEANTIVVGWKGFTRTQKRILGKKMDLLLRLTPCDVVLLKGDEGWKPDRIMILSGGLWHVSRATEVVAIIAKRYRSRVTILNVIVDDKYLDVARTYSKRLMDILEKEQVPVVVKEIRPESVVGGVVAESLDYDLLVMGSSAVKRVHRSDFGLVQDRIVKAAQCPVLVYKRVATFEDKEFQEKEVVDVIE